MKYEEIYRAFLKAHETEISLIMFVSAWILIYLAVITKEDILAICSLIPTSLVLLLSRTKKKGEVKNV